MFMVTGSPSCGLVSISKPEICPSNNSSNVLTGCSIAISFGFTETILPTTSSFNFLVPYEDVIII